ncbi:MAG: dihydropyrimidinase [Clostridiales bacterium]|jgi:dihydropyrimidinase|nr:dihydropyrimidinase [Clostridiales bacterium]
MRLLIKNALIATASEVFPGAVLSERGKISLVLRNPDASSLLEASEGAFAIDAFGMHLLPGGVDPHTHFDLDVGFAKASDDFYTGSIAAACGGTTTFIDHMAFGPKGCDAFHQYIKYREISKDSVIDYGLHGVLQDKSQASLESMRVLKEREGVSSFKIYLTYDFKLDEASALEVLKKAKQLDITVCVHCEDDGLLADARKKLLQSGRKSPIWHASSRPAQAEANAIKRILELALQADEAKVYIVHLSSEMGLNEISNACEAGRKNIFVETCPQYLFLDESSIQTEEQALKLTMSPPPRKPSDRKALWEGLRNGIIHTIGTDHCPFFYKTQKIRGKDDFTACPNGLPGVELRMTLMYSEGYIKRKLPLTRVVELCCAQPARIFGLGSRKGDISPGLDADFVLFDPSAKYKVTAANLHENVDYTPYEGMEVEGAPVMVISGGKIIVNSNEFLGRKGSGRYLMRS